MEVRQIVKKLQCKYVASKNNVGNKKSVVKYLNSEAVGMVTRAITDLGENVSWVN